MAERGGPPKPKAGPPAKGRGRPAEPLRNHQHRFEIAAFKAAERCLGLGARKTSKGLVAAAFGEPVPLNPKHPELAVLSLPLSRKQFDQHADLIRKLASRFPKTADDAAWLRAVGSAIMAGFDFGPHEKDAAKKAALNLAVAAGEERWARQVLLPWIDAMKTKADLEADHEQLARVFVDLLSQP
jgi:hypothetical protein